MRRNLDLQMSLRQKFLIDYLGEGYTENYIDKEPVIYRDLGDYDVEISGGHTKEQTISIFVWSKRLGRSWNSILACRSISDRSDCCWMISPPGIRTRRKTTMKKTMSVNDAHLRLDHLKEGRLPQCGSTEARKSPGTQRRMTDF